MIRELHHEPIELGNQPCAIEGLVRRTPDLVAAIAFLQVDLIERKKMANRSFGSGYAFRYVSMFAQPVIASEAAMATTQRAAL